jgi:hypothetical protein
MLCTSNRKVYGVDGAYDGPDSSSSGPGSSSSSPSTSPERGGGLDRDFSSYGDNGYGPTGSGGLNVNPNMFDDAKLGWLGDLKGWSQSLLRDTPNLPGPFGRDPDYQDPLGLGDFDNGLTGNVNSVTATGFGWELTADLQGTAHIGDFNVNVNVEATFSGVNGALNSFAVEGQALANFDLFGNDDGFVGLGVGYTNDLRNNEQGFTGTGVVGVRFPLLLDVGKGIGFNQSGTVSYDWEAGYRYSTGWADKYTGMLAYDENGDGHISGKRELALTEHKAGAKSDLEGLSAFDSNKDGVFDKKDTEFSKFKVWVDKNQDGISQIGELKTLNNSGIKSINLRPTIKFSEAVKLGKNYVGGMGTYTSTDGKVRALADVGFSYDEENAVKVDGSGRGVFKKEDRQSLNFWIKKNNRNTAALSALAAAAGSAGYRADAADLSDYKRDLAAGIAEDLETFYGTVHSEGKNQSWIDGRVLMDLNIPGQETKAYAPTLVNVADSSITSEAAYAAPTLTDIGWHLAAGVTLNGSVTGQGASVGGQDIITGLDFGLTRTQIAIGAPISADPPPLVTPELPLNLAPTVVGERLAAVEDAVMVIDPARLLANDQDVDGGTLTIVAVSGAIGGTVELLPDGTIQFTPDADYTGTAQFTYTVDDGQGGISTATAVLAIGAVNDAPLTQGETLAGTEDTAQVLLAADLLANDSDIEGNGLSITDVQALAGGTAVLQPDGNILFTPNPDFFGSAQVRYLVSDGGTSSWAVATIQVAGTADAPIASNETLGLVEDTNAVIAAAALLGNDIDVDGEVLKIVGIVGATGGTATLTANGDIFFEPTANLNGAGAGSITYIVEDPTGLQSTATATLDIASVNDAPVVTGEILGTVYHGTGSLVIPAANLLANDSDVDGDVLSIGAVGAAVGGAVAIAPDGSVVFTPDAAFNGQASFTYTVEDGNGGQQTVSVEFPIATNLAPTATDDVLADSLEDGVRIISFAELLGNDSDPEGMAIEIVGVQAVEGATVELVDGGIKVTPLENYSGPVRFNYLLQDELGAQNVAQASFTLTAVNDAPITGDETIAATEDTKLVMTFDQLLKNDVDVEGDSLTITGVAGATHGSVKIDTVAETVTFTLDQNYHGDAGFTYTVSDGKGGTTEAKVTLDVAAVNDAPTVKGELLAGVEDTVYKVKLSSLLSNDTDADGDTLTISAVTAKTGVGTVVISGDYVIMTPTKNFDGNASFEYTVSDGNGGSTVSTAVVSLAGVDDGPTSSTKGYTVHEGKTKSGVIPVADIDGGTYQYGAPQELSIDGTFYDYYSRTPTSPHSGNTIGMRLIIDDDGSFSWRPTYEVSWHDGGFESAKYVFVGTVTFKVAVTDSQGRTAYTTLSLTNDSLPPPPVDVPDHGKPIILDLDHDGEVLTALSTSNAAYDWNGDGIAHKTAWADQGDGFLMLDRNHDGKAQAEDIIFSNDHKDAETDMDGVRLAYDSNHDGKLDASDATFGDFKIWQDTNQDGISQESEIKTLAEHGITSIGLEAPRVDEVTDGGIIHRWTEVTFEDGATTKAGDVSIAHHDTPTISVEQQAAVLIEAMASFVPETQDQNPIVNNQPIPDWFPAAEEDLKIAV